MFSMWREKEVEMREWTSHPRRPAPGWRGLPHAGPVHAAHAATPEGEGVRHARSLRPLGRGGGGHGLPVHRLGAPRQELLQGWGAVCGEPPQGASGRRGGEGEGEVGVGAIGFFFYFGNGVLCWSGGLTVFFVTVS